MSTSLKDKVLIIEDEQSISNFISTILSTNGYDTLVAVNGTDALSMITSHCPDIIILDLGLPDMAAFCDRYGSSWAYHLADVIRDVDQVLTIGPSRLDRMLRERCRASSF